MKTGQKIIQDEDKAGNQVGSLQRFVWKYLLTSAMNLPVCEAEPFADFHFNLKKIVVNLKCFPILKYFR
jgi:hypothetical protein